jgi:hypothetical protein
MAYNGVEAVVALWSGIDAESSVLVGFGLDSIIEFAAAGVLLWRFAAEARGEDDEVVDAREHLVHRLVGATFLGLALYVSGEALATLYMQSAPEESRVGIALLFCHFFSCPPSPGENCERRKRLEAQPFALRQKRPLRAPICR